MDVRADASRVVIAMAADLVANGVVAVGIDGRIAGRRVIADRVKVDGQIVDRGARIVRRVRWRRCRR